MTVHLQDLLAPLVPEVGLQLVKEDREIGGRMIRITVGKGFGVVWSQKVVCIRLSDIGICWSSE